MLLDGLNLGLVALELHEEVAVLDFALVQLLLVEVDDHSKSARLTLHLGIEVIFEILKSDLPLALDCGLVGHVVLDLVHVVLLNLRLLLLVLKLQLVYVLHVLLLLLLDFSFKLRNDKFVAILDCFNLDGVV